MDFIFAKYSSRHVIARPSRTNIFQNIPKPVSEHDSQLCKMSCELVEPYGYLYETNSQQT